MKMEQKRNFTQTIRMEKEKQHMGKEKELWLQSSFLLYKFGSSLCYKI